jgi:hypothetical protein
MEAQHRSRLPWPSTSDLRLRNRTSTQAMPAKMTGRSISPACRGMIAVGPRARTKRSTRDGNDVRAPDYRILQFAVRESRAVASYFSGCELFQGGDSYGVIHADPTRSRPRGQNRSGAVPTIRHLAKRFCPPYDAGAFAGFALISSSTGSIWPIVHVRDRARGSSPEQFRNYRISGVRDPTHASPKRRGEGCRGHGRA